MPGTLLRSGRYRLQENRDIQEWLKRVYEATWIAQDAQRGGMQVIICELSIPDDVALPVQTILRQATIALTSIGRHPRVPTLWDAFSDQGKHFFVFEPMQGETLLERMRRTGRAFSEQRVIEMALQMIDVIERFHLWYMALFDQSIL
jgi:serine/threonine protein kinase